MTHLDLECCQLTEYAGQLFLTLFTKYPVKLEEICLDKNPAMLGETRALIQECLGLKSRRNSVSTETPMSTRLPLHDNPISLASDNGQPVKMVQKNETKPVSRPVEPARRPIEPSPTSARNAPKSVSFGQRQQPVPPLDIKGSNKRDEEDDADIEELLPIDTPPYGSVGPRLYWNRV